MLRCQPIIHCQHRATREIRQASADLVVALETTYYPAATVQVHSQRRRFSGDMYLGILRLSKQHGEERLEAACQTALALGACSYKSLESILRQGLERLPLAQQNLPLPPEEHINLRGPGYYH